MGSPLPPDPYVALGVPKDATSAAIKGAYRKLVLKFHPDKVTDEAQKQAASDQFHKIQTAYEIVGDEDRRARYDAQCKLADLRRDVMERQGGTHGSRVNVATAAYKMPTDSPGRATFNARGPERSERIYEERRPSYDADYFDRPRATARKDHDYERAKRTSPRDDREQVRVSRQQAKENERARQQAKTKQTSKDTRRDRASKYEPISEEDSDSSDSVNERSARRVREEEEQRRAAKIYYEQVEAQKEASQRGYYDDDRTRKMFAGDSRLAASVADAASYIDRSKSRPYPEVEQRRSSPPRVASNSKVEYIKRDGRPTVMYRRGSGKTSTRGREEESPRRPSQREREVDRERPRRSSAEIVDEPRRPPTLSQTKSAPQDIRLPEKHRSYSLQTDIDRREDVPPQLKRAETEPHMAARVDAAIRKPTKGSSLRESVRQTEMSEGLPTPGATPDWTGSAPSAKYDYRRQYADDNEYPTPDGYRTEVREPAGASRKMTRSPSPIRELREKPRAASSRYPTAQPPRPSRTTSYVYTPSGVEAMPSRPSMSREDSSRSKTLYGEIPTVRSPRQQRSKYSPPPEGVRYQSEARPEQIRAQTGYTGSRRSSEARPTYSRQNSFQTSVYAS